MGRSVHSSGEKSVCRRWGGGGSGTKGEEEGEEEGGGGVEPLCIYTHHKLTNRSASGIAR